MNTSSSADNSLIIKSDVTSSNTSSVIDIGGRILSTGDGKLKLQGTYPFIELNGYNINCYSYVEYWRRWGRYVVFAVV